VPLEARRTVREPITCREISPEVSLSSEKIYKENISTAEY